jgi:hypothetical protein
VECLRCKSANPEGQHYCGNCGTLLDPALGPLRDALEASLRSQLTSLAERWKDQKVVEEETEKAIRKELVESARKIGRRVAVAVIVSADLKGSQFSRFRCEPESLPEVAEHTNAAAAVRNKQS